MKSVGVLFIAFEVGWDALAFNLDLLVAEDLAGFLPLVDLECFIFVALRVGWDVF